MTRANRNGLPFVSDLYRELQAGRQDAACRGCDPDLFYPPSAKSGRVGLDVAREAKATCAACPVLTECAIYALRTKQQFGVWAGMSPKELRRARGRLAPWLDEDAA